MNLFFLHFIHPIYTFIFDGFHVCGLLYYAMLKPLYSQQLNAWPFKLLRLVYYNGLGAIA